MNKIFYLLPILFCWNCTRISETEKYQSKRDNIVNVRDKVMEIEMDDVFIGSISRLFLIDKYLVISDPKSYDELIHLFDRKNFSYLGSAVDKGEGPGEVANMGYVGVNESERLLYISDHAKQRIFSYQLDSILVDPNYMPQVKVRMNESRFPSEYLYVNDTVCYGRIIEPIGNNDFKPSVAQWNMTTGEIKLMEYEHPDIDKKRISFAVSTRHNLYVELYAHHDLISICTLDGKLKYNIYGKEWKKERGRIDYYTFGEFCGDQIVALYSGEDGFYKDKNGELRSNQPTKFQVFDIHGNYLQTLETGYRISHFCYDEVNHRLLMSLDDEIQFAYLDLAGII